MNERERRESGPSEAAGRSKGDRRRFLQAGAALAGGAAVAWAKPTVLVATSSAMLSGVGGAPTVSGASRSSAEADDSATISGTNFDPTAINNLVILADTTTFVVSSVNGSCTELSGTVSGIPCTAAEPTQGDILVVKGTGTSLGDFSSTMGNGVSSNRRTFTGSSSGSKSNGFELTPPTPATAGNTFVPGTGVKFALASTGGDCVFGRWGSSTVTSFACFLRRQSDGMWFGGCFDLTNTSGFASAAVVVTALDEHITRLSSDGTLGFTVTPSGTDITVDLSATSDRGVGFVRVT